MRHKPVYGLLGAAAAALFATTSLTPTSQAQAPTPAPTPAQPVPQLASGKYVLRDGELRVDQRVLVDRADTQAQRCARRCEGDRHSIDTDNPRIRL